MAKTPTKTPRVRSTGVRGKTSTRKTTSRVGPRAAKSSAVKKASGKKARTKSTGRRRVKRAARAFIRMYTHGLGDCFLLRFPREGGGKPYAVLIDCGVILGTPDATSLMREVVQDVIAVTEGKVDLVVGTHEHFDHLSGFLQAAEDFKNLEVGAVWLGWTEDPHAPEAKALQNQRSRALAMLRKQALRLRATGRDADAGLTDGVLSFFGLRGSTADALEAVRTLAPKPPRYCRPKDPPQLLPGTGVRTYVLGPPTDPKFLKKYAPSRREPETYGVDQLDLRLDEFGSSEEGDLRPPFDAKYVLPTVVAKATPFFQTNYFGTEWLNRSRSIDGAWLDDTSALALQLDSATNNTSLVLAFELPGGDVLLFAADAQVGNWLSWQQLSWSVDGQARTGPNLLEATRVYKVGHHGSHNATLREKGLDLMKALEVALIPVDKKMAEKKKWNRMPLDVLVDALKAKAAHVVQSDEASEAEGLANFEVGKNFVELTVV